MAIQDSGKVIGKEVAGELKKVSDQITGPMKSFFPSLISQMPGGAATEKAIKALKVSNKKEQDENGKELEKQTTSLVGQESLLGKMNDNLAEMSQAITGVSHTLAEPEDTSLSAAEVEKSNEEKRAAARQITLLEQISTGIGDMLKSFMDSVAKGGGMGLGVIAGLVAAPVIALVNFFKTLSVEFKFLTSLGKRIAGGKFFAPIRFIFDMFSKGFDDLLGLVRFGLKIALLPATTFFRLFPSIGTAFSGLLNGLLGFMKMVGQGAKFGEFFAFIGGMVMKVVNLVKGMFTPVVSFFTGTSKVAGGFMATFQPIAKFAATFGQVLGKIFLPITILMSAFDFITGFIDGYKTDGILGGLEGGLSKLFGNLIGMPLDLLKSAVGWIAGVFGFDGVKGALESFSFKDLIGDMIGGIFDGVSGVFTFLGDLFDFSDLTIFSAFSKLIDIVFLPLNMAINFVKGIFGFGDPEEPFSLGAFALETVSSVITWIKSLFTDPLAALNTLWTTLLGGYDSLFSLISWPIDAAVNWIMGVFGWSDPEGEPFSLWGLIKDTAKGIFDFFAGLLDIDIMGLVKSIPGAGKVLSWFGFGDEDPPLESPANQTTEEQIAAAKARINASMGGENVYSGFDSSGRKKDAELIERLVAERAAELEAANNAVQAAERENNTPAAPMVFQNNSNTNNVQQGGGRTQQIIPIEDFSTGGWNRYAF